MNKLEMVTQREIATFHFLTENEGSRLISVPNDHTAIVGTGGLTQDQLKLHATLCIVSLGLWIPVFWVVALLRRRQTWIITVDWKYGITEIREL